MRPVNKANHSFLESLTHQTGIYTGTHELTLCLRRTNVFLGASLNYLRFPPVHSHNCAFLPSVGVTRINILIRDFDIPQGADLWGMQVSQIPSTRF